MYCCQNIEIQRTMFSVIKIAIFLLSVCNVHGDSRQEHNQHHRSYYDYGNSDDQTSSYRYNDPEARIPLTINWRWPFKPPNTIKVTRQPLSNMKEDENDMVPNDKFLFPDTDIKTLGTRIGPAPVCEGKTFCEEVSDYPLDIVDAAIRNDQKLQNYDNTDAMDNISFRIDTVTTESLCLSNQQIIYPKSAENMNKQWRFILNNANFTQGINIETCTHEGKSCKLFGGFAAGYITACEQKFTYRRLAAIAEDGTISRDLFRFPASCCCHVRFVANSTRMRTDRSASSQSRQKNASDN